MFCMRALNDAKSPEQQGCARWPLTLAPGTPRRSLDLFPQKFVKERGSNVLLAKMSSESPSSCHDSASTPDSS